MVETATTTDSWTPELLGSLGKWLSGGTPSMSNPEYWGGDIPWVSPKDMKRSRLWESIDHVTSKALGNGTRLAPIHSLLLVVRGMILAHTFPVARAERPLAFNQDIKCFVVRQDVDSEFLLWWLTASEALFLGLTTESTHGTKRLSTDALHGVEISLPPLTQQHAIAKALNDIDSLLNSLDRLITKKRDLKQAAMQQLLTGQTRLPGFHGAWEVKRLGDVAELDPENLGASTPASFRFNYIALEDVDRGALVGHSEQHFESAPSRARRRLRGNDVLVSTVRPNLQSHLLFVSRPGEWVCSTGFCVVRCRPGVANPAFVFAHLFTKPVARQINALLAGSNYPAINGRDVGALEMSMPEYAEQSAIAAILSDLNAELTALEARRNKTRCLKQAMMQELLTGRTRLL